MTDFDSTTTGAQAEGGDEPHPQASAAPGWYPDSAPGIFRYYDGQQWTGFTATYLPDKSPFLLQGEILRRSAVKSFWGGIGVGVVASLIGLAALASDDGGVIWTGGLVVGAILLFRAFDKYRGSRAKGVPPPTPAGWLAVGSALLVTLGLAAMLGLGVLDNQSVSQNVNKVGSCWDDVGGGKLAAVSCDSDKADYQATRETQAPITCPDIYTDGRPGWYLCLSPK